MPTPDQPNHDRHWPSCDDPQPGLPIRPLTHADLAALLAHLDQHNHDQDLNDPLEPGGPAPLLAVQVRANVGQPGASPRPNTAGGARSSGPLGPAAFPGGPPPSWPPGWPPGCSPPR